ncbi:MAG: glycerophosphoryl diester phosphodiesterase membrane domain-containing protein [Eubacterium sp.]|nr:glycerophosphoryl diester phosphodiesterase membrane domain-containing protein [Eubacterium sp.]
MRRFRTAFAIIRRNLGVLAGFEIIYKLATTALFVPLIYGTIQLTMFLTGYTYLTAENIFKFLKNPLFLICPLILLAAVGIYVILDVGAVIYIIDQSYHKKKTDILSAFRFALFNAKTLLRAKRITVVPILVLLLMLTSVSLIPGALDRLALPDNLLRQISKHPIPFIAAGAGIVILLIIFLHWMYAFHYVALEGCTVSEACKKSTALGKGHRLEDLAVFYVQQLVYFGLYALLIAVELFLVVFFSRLFPWSVQLNAFSTSVTIIILLITLIVFTVLGMPFAYVCICMLYYDHKQKKGEPIISIPVQKRTEREREQQDSNHDGVVTPEEFAAFMVVKKKHRKKVLVIEWCMIVFSVAAISFYISGMQRGWFNPQIEYLHTMEVTAHRGASADYPENTMAAFQGAVDLGADWIELDVHMSSDGQIFVMHDSSFRRTTGVDAYAWSLPYEEIAKLDAGSHFSGEFMGERIPLLSEVIVFAKNANIRLNIEIKPSAQEAGLEEKLVQMIQDEEFIGNCVVTSQNYHSIEKVKELDETITTVYVMGFAYGGISRLGAADAFSIRHTSVTDQIVSRVHNRGKQLYAWTVNNRYNINEMISKNVDNIITDNIRLAKECVEKSQTGDIEQEYLRIINHILDNIMGGL